MKNYKYILTHTPSTNLTVEYSPLNWDKFQLMLRRSDRYHSILRPQIIDSEFPRDGKAYIDTIYNAYGIDAEIGCEIQYLDKSTYTYATLFDGIIDLSEWTSNRDTTIVKIADSSTMAKFASRDEIKIPINRLTDLDGNTISEYTYLNTMSVPGVNIESTANYINPLNYLPITSAVTAAGTVIGYFGIAHVDWHINNIGADATLPAISPSTSSASPIYTNNSGGSIDVRYRVKGRIEGHISIYASVNWEYFLQLFTGVNSAVTGINITNSGIGNSEDDFDETYDSGYVTVTLAAGETVNFHHKVTVYNLTGDNAWDPSYYWRPTVVEVYEIIAGKAATDVDMPMFHELGAKLLEIITGQSDPLNAPLLGRTTSNPRSYASIGSYARNGLSSGNILMCRSATYYPLTTSFYDFFKSLDALFNLGMHYDQTNDEFIIADKADYYDSTNKIISLGEVKDLEISISQEDYFNSINCGYKDKVDYEDINGNQVFHVPASFANNTKRIQNTKDLQCVYHADDYGIELARKNADLDTSEDSRYDDQLFIVIGKPDGVTYAAQQGYDLFTDIDGVYSPSTRLNLFITPKRNLLRNANLLSIPLFISKGDTNYMTKQFELDLSTKKSGADAVVERGDLAYTDLEEPLYCPEIYNFTAPVTKGIVLQLLSDPHGYVEFTHGGSTYNGFIKEVTTEPFNRQGNWTLLKVNPNLIT